MSDDASYPERERVAKGESFIEIESMFGVLNQRGLVKITITEKHADQDFATRTFLSPNEARQQGIYLIEAALAAQRDEAFFAVAKEMDMSDHDAERFMRRCRETHARGAS